MWVRVGILFITAASVLSQQTHTRVNQGGASFEWGWQLTPPPDGPGTVGHYYVKLPQSEQRVNYAADGSGYHGAIAINNSDSHHVHTASFALGQRALQLNAQQTNQINQLHYQPESDSNTTQLSAEIQDNGQAPVEIFLLQQQFSAPAAEELQILSNTNPYAQYSVPTYYYNSPSVQTQQLYNVLTQHPTPYNQQKYVNNEPSSNNNAQLNENHDSSKPLQYREETTEQNHDNTQITPIVQVFKDHNCSNEENNKPENVKDYVDKLQKPTKVEVEVPSYDLRNINGNFGIKDRSSRIPLTYRGAVNFRLNPSKQNEKYYYTTQAPSSTQKTVSYTDDEGISKLVASTQDLISNEDLLKINHAAEKHIQPQSDDIIKPKPRFSLQSEQTRYNRYYEFPQNKITVRAKIGNIVNSDIEHIENDESKERILQTGSNEYRFASPIVVQDPAYYNYKEQIVSNLVSTMVPYIENGYEIVGVRNTLPENSTQDYTDNIDDFINVTPRPIGQKYLAPITVALRLLNANDTQSLNSIEDHDTSDSEFVPNTVESPKKERTIVEIQESIPVEITHINDIEVHEYLEEGRSNNKGPLDMARSLYNKYVKALESSEKIQQNMNDILYKYNALKNSVTSIAEEENNDSQEKLESSENIQTEVEVKPHDENTSNERSEFVNDYYQNYDDNQKIIQPIIIEKEVPVTKFVDRFIEKQVPYPEPVEVIKHVDRHIAVPVPYEKVVEKPVEVTKYVDKPYPVEVHHPYPVEIKVPYPVEQKVYIDRPVHVPYPIEKIVEKQVVQQVPVPTPVAVPYEVQVPVEQNILYPIPIERRIPVPVEVEKPVTVEKIVHKEVPVPYAVEKKVPYPVHYETKVPVPYPVERKVPVEVEKIVEKPVTITRVVEKPVHIQVPVPHPVPFAIHVPQPYPVERIVEKKVPYPVHVDRIVEKKVRVNVPYPVEKIVEKPVVVTKYVDKPYPVEKQVPYPVHVDRIVEKKIPVNVPYPVEKIVEKIVEKPVYVTKYIDKPYPVEKRVPYSVEKNVERKVPYAFHVPVEVKVPYPVEKFIDKQVLGNVPYKYENPNVGTQQSQNIPHYLKYNDPNKKGITHHIANQTYAAEYYQYIRDKPVQTTHWGNLYASPLYNNTDYKKAQLNNYLGYLTNGYYGSFPQNVDNVKNKYSNLLRRTDRVPKLTNVRIEYGGFKPPLIPSTEVDLDGIPVNSDGH